MNGIMPLDYDPAWNSHVGACCTRTHGLPKPTGSACYGTDDVTLGVAWCTILRRPPAGPRICSTDTSKIQPLLRGMLR
jgi:hypothetical protein